jgi:hypothetical protein
MEGFNIRTIFGTPFQRNAKLTYMMHMNQSVSSLWGLTFPVSFKNSASTVIPPPKDLPLSYKCLLQNDVCIKIAWIHLATSNP